MGENKELLKKKKLNKLNSKSSDLKKIKKNIKNKNPILIEKNCIELKKDEVNVKSLKKIRKHGEDKQDNHPDDGEAIRIDETNQRKKKRKVPKNKEIEEDEIISNEMKESSDGDIEAEEKQRRKLRKLKRKGKKTMKPEIEKVEESDHEFEGSNLRNAIRIDETNQRKKKRKVSKNKEIDKAVIISNEMKDSSDGDIEAEEKQRKKLRKLKRKGKKTKKLEIEEGEESDHEFEGSNLRNGMSKKVRKVKDYLGIQKEDFQEDNEAKQDGVYEISSGDEDSSKGMKKWITEYNQSRPGVEVLQDRIDDFIVSHEAQLEQERKEREALAAEGGWTVVVHQKGRKKTTESETGTAVGAAHAAVADRIGKKKNKQVGLDFYRFQKREAQKSEIMMLQSKFELDKKRIQQMRAARKFKPY